MYIPTMRETDPKRMIMAYMKKTGLKAYQVADLARVPRVSLYRFLSGAKDLKLAQWHSVEKIIVR
jgi:predicted transcriptional regulator